jgi:hypothetical protein
MGPPDATPTRNVRWQTDDEEEEAGGLEEWRDGEEQPRLYTGRQADMILYVHTYVAITCVYKSHQGHATHTKGVSI